MTLLGSLLCISSQMLRFLLHLFSWWSSFHTHRPMWPPAISCRAFSVSSYSSKPHLGVSSSASHTFILTRVCILLCCLPVPFPHFPSMSFLPLSSKTIFLSCLD